MSDKSLDLTFKEGFVFGIMGTAFNMYAITFQCKENALTRCDFLNRCIGGFRVVEINLGV